MAPIYIAEMPILGYPTSRLLVWRRGITLAAGAGVLVITTSACGLGGGNRSQERQSVREEEVETLVGLSVGDDVTCRDNGAVNSGLHPEALVTFICRNATDEVYAATVSPDGRLTSLSGPVHLKPASG